MSKNPYDRASDPAKRHSAAMTDGPDRAPARAMLKAVGFTDEDLAATVTIDLAAETMTTPDGTAHRFPIDLFSQKMLLDGLDELDYIRTQTNKIEAHETAHPGTINTLQPNAPR